MYKLRNKLFLPLHMSMNFTQNLQAQNVKTGMCSNNFMCKLIFIFAELHVFFVQKIVVLQTYSFILSAQEFLKLKVYG
jgi:hypothetical protein